MEEIVTIKKSTFSGVGPYEVITAPKGGWGTVVYSGELAKCKIIAKAFVQVGYKMGPFAMKGYMD